MMKKAICAVLCLAMAFLMTACGIEIPQEETQTIVFSRRFLGIADAYPEDWIESINNMGEDQYVQLYINDDGESVTMEINSAQRKYWLSIVEKGLHNLQKGITELNSKYKIVYSDDYSHMDVY